jgi:uncharacterized membrane protein YgdD (TMEM256/DUF423 family)
VTAPAERALAALGALAGGLGVALAAAAAHLSGPGSAETAARFLLFHAPALLAISAILAAGLAHRGLGRAAGFMLALGLALFCGDLALRGLRGSALLPYAAPAGGVLLIGGWAVLEGALLIGRRGGGRA